MDLFWTEERIAELKRLWATGISARKIGGELGATRNAVLGKSHRLELTPRVHKRVAGFRARSLSIPKPKPWRLELVKPKPSGIVSVTSKITGSLITLKRPQRPTQAEMSKPQLRAMLEQAMANTAAMQ